MSGYPLMTYESLVLDIIMTILEKFKYLLFALGNHDSDIIDLSKVRKEYIAKKAPEDILTIYGNLILRLAVSYLHNISDGEDVLQDTLIKYLEKQPKFKSEDHEKAWLLRVSGNLSKNKIKYNNNRKHSDVNEDIIGEDSPELSCVWEAIKQLPLKYSEVIHLYYEVGYSTFEIGNILSKKESTVRSLMHRARKMLKETLREEYDFCE